MNPRIAKSVYHEKTQILDRETGELVTESSTNVLRYTGEPAFIKLYLDDICSIIKVPETLKKTLFLILRKLDYDGYITLSKRYRKLMCEQMNIKDGTLRNRLNMLCQHGFIISEGGNEYLANPNYFAKGEWKSIVEQRSAFELRIRYSEDGKEITTKAV